MRRKISGPSPHIPSLCSTFNSDKKNRRQPHLPPVFYSLKKLFFLYFWLSDGAAVSCRLSLPPALLWHQNPSLSSAPKTGKPRQALKPKSKINAKKEVVKGARLEIVFVLKLFPRFKSLSLSQKNLNKGIFYTAKRDWETLTKSWVTFLPFALAAPVFCLSSRLSASESPSRQMALLLLYPLLCSVFRSNYRTNFLIFFVFGFTCL